MKKLMALLLTVSLAVGVLAFPACNKRPPKTENDLYIFAMEQGYGVQFISALAEAFEAKYADEEINVYFDYNVSAEKLDTTMRLGPGKNEYDLFFSMGSVNSIVNSYTDVFSGYKNGVEDLTDMFDDVIPGEEVTFGDKMLDTFNDYINMGTEENPKYYGVPWATGVLGMNYNIDTFRAVYGDGYESHLPRTTDELIEVCGEIKAAGKTPFITIGQLDYFSTSMLYPWWAQYEGLDNYLNFFKGLAYDEMSESYVLSKEIFSQNGRLEALKVMFECVSQKNGYVDIRSLDYNQSNFRTAQVRFLESSLGYAMYPCGDWLEQESASDAGDRNAPFAMMQTPVISSITHRLKTVKSEEALKAVIDYVDGKTDDSSVAQYDPEDIEEVRIARNMATSTHGLGHIAFIPSYATNKDLAKKFLMFMASDEGIRIYKENVKGGFLPFKYDYSSMELSSFETSVSEMIDNLECVGEYTHFPLVYKAGVSCWYSSQGYVDAMLMANPDGNVFKTPLEIFNSLKYTQGQWDQAMGKIGM